MVVLTNCSSPSYAAYGARQAPALDCALFFLKRRKNFSQTKARMEWYSRRKAWNVYIAMDKSSIAAQLIGWADATREKIGDTRPLLEHADVDKITTVIVATIG